MPLNELSNMKEAEIRSAVEGILAEYRISLPDDLKVLLDGYRVVDAARKIVGVGSVGTHCWIALLEGVDDPSDDLVLQLKEATTSVLEPVTEPSTYDSHGRRVVEGQRLMQSASDMLLGWTLARAHARSGDRFALAAYLGSGRAFTRAMQESAVLYADQNQRDYEAFMQAITEGRIPRADISEN